MKFPWLPRIGFHILGLACPDVPDFVAFTDPRGRSHGALGLTVLKLIVLEDGLTTLIGTSRYGSRMTLRISQLYNPKLKSGLLIDDKRPVLRF